MKQVLLFIFILIIGSCGEPEYCDLFNHREPDFLLVNLVDEMKSQDLVFGSASPMSVDEIDVQIKTDDTTYILGSISAVFNNQDSILLIHLREQNGRLQNPLSNELIINYNNQFPSDTLYIDYVLGDCKDFGDVPYDYNISSNTGDICSLCFQEMIEILK